MAKTIHPSKKPTTYEVIDNFISAEQFLPLQDLFLPERNAQYTDGEKISADQPISISTTGDGVSSTTTVTQYFIPWVFRQKIAGYEWDDWDDPKAWKLFYMSHVVYQDKMGIMSPYYPLFHPLLDLLELKTLKRITCNLFPNTEEVVEHAAHSDADFPHKTALFYINTCNGYTTLEDGTKIDSVENRMLKFDGSGLHKSSTTSDQTVRINVNISYF